MNSLITELKRVRRERKSAYICGNGGSASTSEHFSNDLFSKGIKAFCLNSNVAILTMISNDFGYEFVFSKQLDVFGKQGDLLITLSASGTSKNIVMAINKAKIMGISVYEFESAKDKLKINYEELENKHLIMVHKIKQLL